MGVTLIKEVRLVDPAAGIDRQCDVLVASGRVSRIAESISPDHARSMLNQETARQEFVLIDAAGLWLWPGLVDAHVHLREPGFTEKETVRTGGLAAAAGGYTTLICEPNTEPPIDSVDLVRQLAEKCRTESAVNVYLKAAMTQGRHGKAPTDIAALAREQCVVALSDDGDPVAEPAVMASVCRAAAEAGIVLTPHCEDSPRALEDIASGVSPGFEPVEPYANEANYIERDLTLTAENGCRIHFSHVSMARSVTVIESFRGRAAAPSTITFETAPHHLLLCADDYAKGQAPTVNPPLRSAADLEALVGALVSGRVDVVASDHAPHTARDKAQGVRGLIGLETTLGLILTHFVDKGRLSLPDAVRLMSLHPARIFELPAGTLQPGSPADMVLIDPAMEWAVDPEAFRSKSRNTPFGDWRLRGKAVATFVGGRQVYSDPAFDKRKSG